MKLLLYSVIDGQNVINKELPVPHEIQIKLKNDVDVINPIIVLRNEIDVNYDDFNYAFIDVLERYYFVDKLARVSGRDSWLYLSCDVLETYKDDILNSNASFKRKLKSGDRLPTNLDFSVDAKVTINESNKMMVKGESLIVTTIGVYDN